jgi:hypothetical protein
MFGQVNHARSDSIASRLGSDHESEQPGGNHGVDPQAEHHRGDLRPESVPSISDARFANRA